MCRMAFGGRFNAANPGQFRPDLKQIELPWPDNSGSAVVRFLH
jgi:hypothetical protein